MVEKKRKSKKTFGAPKAVAALIGLVILYVLIAISPVSPRESNEKIVVIKKGASVTTIAKTLKSEGLIRSPFVFKVIVYYYRLTDRVQAGSFRLSPSDSTREIALALTEGRLDQWITIPEGLRNEEIAESVAKIFNIPQSEFLVAAQGLQGKLFPDTYLIPIDASAETIVSIMHNTYKKRVESLKSQMQQSSLTEDEVIILASIVERETLTDEEKPIVAGILIKRSENGWPLQTDATLQYIVGDEGEWWPVPTSADKQRRSPYNTYQNLGLPPQPIANPGLEAIQAAIMPTSSNYWFYLHDARGNIYYAATAEEHEANIANYIR